VTARSAEAAGSLGNIANPSLSPPPVRESRKHQRWQAPQVPPLSPFSCQMLLDCATSQLSLEPDVAVHVSIDTRQPARLGLGFHQVERFNPTNPPSRISRLRRACSIHPVAV